MSNMQKENSSFMAKLAGFIVDKRNLFFLITIIGLVFSAFSTSWIEVENTLSEFLPDGTESRQGLDVMSEQFTTYGTAQVMVANVTLDEANKINETLSNIAGIQSVVFDETSEHYNNVSALYTVTFDYDETDDRCLAALDSIETELSDFDYYISTALGNALQETIVQNA